MQQSNNTKIECSTPEEPAEAESAPESSSGSVARAIGTDGAEGITGVAAAAMAADAAALLPGSDDTDASLGPRGRSFGEEVAEQEEPQPGVTTAKVALVGGVCAAGVEAEADAIGDEADTARCSGGRAVPTGEERPLLP
jgi:hypothetical protein